jgi:hypothetical protein
MVTTLIEHEYPANKASMTRSIAFEVDMTDAIPVIQRGMDDFKAGRSRSFEAFVEEKRPQYNLPNS